MPVDSKADRYLATAPKWRLMRDCMAGEDVVKAEGERYLPKPSGMQFAANGARQYDAYRTRARFPDFVARTVAGLLGLIVRKPAEVSLPPALRPLLRRASVDGLSLADFHRRLAREVLVTGRYGIFIDARLDQPPGEPPLFAGYPAEAIINWHERRENGTTALDMLVLDEGETRRDPADPFETRRSERWRVIWQADGVAVETWTRPSPDAPPVPAGPPLPLSGGGRALTEAPFVFVGARDLTADPDEVPLLGLAQTALSLYRRSADYEQSLFMTSQATPVVVGVAGDDPNAPRAIGASTIWHLPQGADAKFLEVSGSGLAAQRQAQEDDFARAMQAGAQLLDHAAAESGEALRLRHAAQSATLVSIARTVAAGIEQALRHAARWIGADPEAVSYRPNLDFVDSAASADVIRAIVDAWSAGAISSRTRHELFQRYELVPVERGHDEESALIGRPDPDAAPAARR